jgi:hypothetical protein
LRFVTQKAVDGRPERCKRFIPAPDLGEWRQYGVYPEDSHIVERVCETIFELANRLLRAKLIDGAFAARDLKVDFRPCSGADFPTGVTHSALAHGHVLANTTREPTFDLLLEIFSIYFDLCLELDAETGEQRVPACPDLKCSRIESQSELNGWLSYMLKPLHFEQWYRAGLARGCTLEGFNIEFNQVVFKGLHHVFGDARSPRKHGNMYSQSRRYIGNRPPPRVNPSLRKAWLGDPVLQAEHPEWEAAVYEAADQKIRRCGARHRGALLNRDEYDP